MDNHDIPKETQEVQINTGPAAETAQTAPELIEAPLDAVAVGHRYLKHLGDIEVLGHNVRASNEHLSLRPSKRERVRSPKTSDAVQGCCEVTRS